MTFVDDLYNGKTIVLVGSSHTLTGRGLGSYIDSFDTVIRMNKSVPVHIDLADDIGTRVDVLYHGLDRVTDPTQKNFVKIEEWIESGVKGIVASCMTNQYTKPYIEHFNELNDGRLPFRTIHDLIRSTGKEIKTKPNTGLICLKDVLQYDIKEIFLTGICFYKTFYYDGYAEVHRSYNQINFHHKLQNHKEYMAKLYKEDKRIKIDDVLETIFKEEGLI
jgi:hypothetical protein